MNIVTLSICLLVALLVNGLSGCMAETYSARAGPYTILATSDEKIEFDTEFSPIVQNDHIACDVNVDVGDSKYKIEIQDYGKAIDINLTKALTVFCNEWFVPTSWDVLDVGGNRGVIASRDTKGENENGISLCPGFEAAYSPDGIGNRGTMIAFISTSAKGNEFKECERKFRDLVKNLRIRRGSKG